MRMMANQCGTTENEDDGNEGGTKENEADGQEVGTMEVRMMETKARRWSEDEDDGQEGGTMEMRRWHRARRWHVGDRRKVTSMNTWRR